MKYVVQVKYTNPAHEHVSLRRRVETVNRIVEAATEQEAINRVANQQRSLGYIIKEAAVQQNAGQVTGIIANDDKKSKKVVGDEDEETEIKKEPVKEARMSAAVKLGRAFDRARAESDASRRRGEELMKQIRDKKEKEGEDAVRKAMEKELEHNPHYKTEEVEIEEGVETAQKVADRAAVVAKTAGDSKKRMAASSLARKAQLRTINPTGVNTGIDRGAGNKATRKMGGTPAYQMDLDKKRASVSEEVEQTDEARKMSRAEWRMGTETDVDKNNKKIYDKLSATDPAKAKAFHDNLMRMKKKDVKEEAEKIDEISNAELRKTDAYKKAMANIKQNRLSKEFSGKSDDVGMNPSVDAQMPSKNQHVKVDHRLGRIVHTYREETDPDKREAGYKMSPAVRKAQAASDELSKKEKKPQAGTLAAKSERAAAKAIDLAKGKKNQINLEPAVEPGKVPGMIGAIK